ncbi:MAG: hypothetical protein KME08_00785 [Aphanothece sp. CMT-3BRIN-NPC111]|jgi:hypothetical protein|nr:hypothetical protein [Aphanothece sp. CMT-3BRIN-NPC111]
MSYISSASPAIAAYDTSDIPVLYAAQFASAMPSEPIAGDALISVNKLIEESATQTNLAVAQSQSFSLTQLPEISRIAQTIEPVGRAPSLQTEPSSPQEKPFQPQKVPLQPLKRTEQESRSSPSITILTPSAYGKSWGDASIGLGLQSQTRFSDKADGVLGVGIGLGNAQQSVGLDVGLTIVDLGNLQDGTFSFKLHRRLPDDFAVAVGVKNLIKFGQPDSGTSAYGVATKMFRLQDSINKPFSRLYLSGGIGSGQFRSESDIKNNIDSVGVFGSLAVRVAEPVTAITEWTGQDLTLGLSFRPFRKIPLVITPAVTDVTGNAGDGSRFILGIGYGTSF